MYINTTRQTTSFNYSPDCYNDSSTKSNAADTNDL